ncbi:hypothetical protein P9112_011656 [Eukaryota sp. TZLM1-RC]
MTIMNMDLASCQDPNIAAQLLTPSFLEQILHEEDPEYALKLLCNCCSTLYSSIPYINDIISTLFAIIASSRTSPPLFATLNCILRSSTDNAALIINHPNVSEVFTSLDTSSFSVNIANFLTNDLVAAQVVDFKLPQFSCILPLVTEFNPAVVNVCCSFVQNEISSKIKANSSNFNEIDVLNLMNCLEFLSNYCKANSENIEIVDVKSILKTICYLITLSADASLKKINKLSGKREELSNHLELLGFTVDLKFQVPNFKYLASYRAFLLSILLNLIHNRDDLQLFTLSIPKLFHSILSFLSLEFLSPLAREWAILLVRCYCVHEEARKMINDLKPVDVVQSLKLSGLGLEDGRVSFTKDQRGFDIEDL